MSRTTPVQRSGGPIAPGEGKEATVGIAWPLMLLLVGISGLGPVTMNGVLPANSAIMAEFSASYGVTQLVLTAFMLATLVSQIVLGAAADRFGRRPVMMGGLCLFTVGSVLCALASSIEWLLLARFVQGFGAAVCLFLPRAIIRDLYPRDRAASMIGYLTTAMMVAPLFGPAIGGWVTDEFDWRYLYWGCAALSLVFVFSSVHTLRETGSPSAWDAVPSGAMHHSSGTRARDAAARGLLGASRVLLREPLFLAYALMLSGSVGVYYSFLAGAPFVAMESRGFSASSYGAWFSMVAIGYLSGNFVAGLMSERIGNHRMIVWGLVPLLLGIALFWLLSGWTSLLGLFIPMQLVAFSNGVSMPNLLSALMSVRPELSASASGLAGSLQTGFGVLLSLAVGYLLPAADAWLFIVITFSALFSVVGLVASRRLCA